MGWVLFGQIVLLIVIFAVVVCFVKCMHDSYCTTCRVRKSESSDQNVAQKK